MMTDDRAPVLIGGGQFLQRDVEPAAAVGPLEMAVLAARRAADDAGAGPALLARLDAIAVVNIFSWHYGNAPRLLAEQLGAQPTTEIYTTLGGNTPQLLVNELAARIASGRVRFALLAGAEAVYAFRRMQRAHVTPAWLSGGDGTPETIGDARQGTSDHEVAHGFQAPVQIYPLFENALRAHAGRTPSAHTRALGALLGRFNAVAAKNPHAWFPTERSADEIATPTATNRYIGYPYTKYMNAVLDVDQAAAVLLTSAGEARALGIPRDRWVYLWASADAVDRWFVSERRNYHSAPALRVAGARVLAAAGVGIDRVRYFDLYSCFSSAVETARDMLGIPASDERSLTVTGGLPYAGGPGSNYTTHAIATMLGRLRADPGALGLVTALGWYITKHAVGIYGAEPPPNGWRRAEPYDDAAAPATDAPALAETPSGAGTIETYTVMHERDGTPVRGLVIGRLAADGRRFLANTPPDREVLEGLMGTEGVGRRGHVCTVDGTNRFDLV
jgi:acetyl-CoA C-acetyltransferase